jgi:hypothetical protein
MDWTGAHLKSEEAPPLVRSFDEQVILRSCAY